MEGRPPREVVELTGQPTLFIHDMEDAPHRAPDAARWTTCVLAFPDGVGDTRRDALRDLARRAREFADAVTELADQAGE